MSPIHLRTLVHHLLEPAYSLDDPPSLRRLRASALVDAVIGLVIVANVVAVVLESVPELHARHDRHFHLFEAVSLLFFIVEYALRLWSAPGERREGATAARLAFVFSPLGLVDLAVILPGLLHVAGVVAVEIGLLRIFRVLRLLRLARYSRPLMVIGHVVATRWRELLGTVGIMVILLVLSSALLYFAEARAQPEAFASIPQAMWWAIATLTTVGYGDVTPITPIGRICAAAVAVFGIGLFALPTGVLGAAFTEQLEQERAEREQQRAGGGSESGGGQCPHCGKALHE